LLEDQHARGFIVNVDAADFVLLIGKVLDQDFDVFLVRLFDRDLLADIRD
jgi:hypothetical protein